MASDKTNESADKDDGERSSLGGGSSVRLSRISYNTKYAIALNQIDRIDVCDAYDRAEDGVTLYVLGVYVLRVQTGIPTASRSHHSKHCRRKWYELPHRRSMEEEPQGDQEEDDRDPHADRKDPLLRKREREKNPHYRVAYRFSKFYQLREELRDVVNAPEDALHTKWCAYCARLNWLVNDAPFPSRWPPGLDKLVNKIAWLKRWRVRRRKRKLALFLKEIVQGARTMQYRFSGNQCDGFLNTAFVLKEFLSEPQLRESFAGW